MSGSQKHSGRSFSNTNPQPVALSRGKEVETMEGSKKQTEPDTSNAGKASNDQWNSATEDKSDASIRTSSWARVSNRLVRTLPDNLMGRSSDPSTWRTGPKNPGSQAQNRQTGCKTETALYSEWGSYRSNEPTKEANKWDAICEDDEGDSGDGELSRADPSTRHSSRKNNRGHE